MEDFTGPSAAIFSLTIYALTCAPYASWTYSKGRSAWTGFLLAFFLTPFVAWIFVLFVRRDQAKLNERAVLKGKLRYCPKCREVIDVRANRCRYCQADF